MSHHRSRKGRAKRSSRDRNIRKQITSQAIQTVNTHSPTYPINFPLHAVSPKPSESPHPPPQSTHACAPLDLGRPGRIPKSKNKHSQPTVTSSTDPPRGPEIRWRLLRLSIQRTGDNVWVKGKEGMPCPAVCLCLCDLCLRKEAMHACGMWKAAYLANVERMYPTNSIYVE